MHYAKAKQAAERPQAQQAAEALGPERYALVIENTTGTNIGVLTAKDDKGDGITWTVDDQRFEVVTGLFGLSAMRLKSGVSLDHETNPQLTLQVTATDSGGLSTTSSFTIAVLNAPEAPTDIALSTLGIDENALSGTVVGTLSATDEDGGSSFTYKLVSGNGVNDADNALVAIDGGTIRVAPGASIDFETNPVLNLFIQVTDNTGLTYSEAFSYR